MFLHQYKLIQLVHVDPYQRWCNLVVLGSCHTYLYILNFFLAVYGYVYLVQLMQVTVSF